MRFVACLLSLVFCTLLAPDSVFAKKKSTVGRPPSKPPVYKKFNNKKKKSTFKWGNASR